MPLSERLAVRSEELAALLGVSPRFLRSIAAELPKIRRGRLVLYSPRHVAAWIDREAKVEGTPVKAVVAELLARRKG